MEQNISAVLSAPIEFQIFAPSYRRPKGVSTHLMIPSIKYVVAESEAESYLAEGLPTWVAPDSAQGNLCRIRNWILDNATCPNILLLDDDFVGVLRWGISEEGVKVQRTLDPSEILAFIEHGFCLAEEMGVRYWGLNCLQDPLSFREYTPFSLGAYIGGPWQAFLSMDLRYDENLPLKEDYDLTLQVLNKYRRVLRFNGYSYKSKQHTNQGGCAVYRTMEREKAQLLDLQNKWGSSIIRVDSGASHVRRTKQVDWDINPIMKIPIRGV